MARALAVEEIDFITEVFAEFKTEKPD